MQGSGGWVLPFASHDLNSSSISITLAGQPCLPYRRHRGHGGQVEDVAGDGMRWQTWRACGAGEKGGGAEAGAQDEFGVGCRAPLQGCSEL